MIATQMRGMGFDVELKSGSKDFDTLDFTFSGQATSMDMGMGGGGMEGAPMPGGEAPVEELPVETPDTVPERAPRNEEEVYDENLDEEEDKDSYENKVFE